MIVNQKPRSDARGSKSNGLVGNVGLDDKAFELLDKAAVMHEQRVIFAGVVAPPHCRIEELAAEGSVQRNLNCDYSVVVGGAGGELVEIVRIDGKRLAAQEFTR